MAEAEKLPPPLPPRLDWFVHTQMGQLLRDGIPEWFHGAISRGDAENLLQSQPPGSFLLRVSHSHVGYTLSYRVQGRCCHAMVMLLDDGCLVLCGQDTVPHASLCALVAFYQRRPLRPHGQLLTRGCGQDLSCVSSVQKDPDTVDYEDLLLHATAMAQEASSPEPGPEEHLGPCSCPEGPPKSTPLHQPKEKGASAEKETEPAGEVAPPGPPRAPFERARQKLWKNLRALPETGRRVQQRLKGHLAAVSLTSLWDARTSGVAHSSGTSVDSRGRWGSTAWKDRVPGNPCVATGLENPPQRQALRDRNVPSRKATRPTSWSGATPGDGAWRQKVVRALSSQPSQPEAEDWLPEEYLQPPPFAPGYF